MDQTAGVHGVGKTTIIVPIGGTEPNRPHMALGKDNARVKALSERIVPALGNALIAPVIAYVAEGTLSLPTAHMRFPGTLTVPGNAFRQTLESAAPLGSTGIHDAPVQSSANSASTSSPEGRSRRSVGRSLDVRADP